MTPPNPAGLPLDHLTAVPTPALVVDVAAARRNHAKAAAALGPRQVLRPHFKAHKSLALARLQLDNGAASICCQTSWEALVLAQAGVKDVMLTNQIVDPAALAETVEAARLTRLSVLVDCQRHVELLEAAAARADVELGVLIEIELGMRRCGVGPDSAELLALANAIQASPHLSLFGIQAYDGHVAGMSDPGARRTAAGRSKELTELAVSRLRAAGFVVPIVAGLSSGHLPFLDTMDVWTDVQAGSYLLMDGAYADSPDLDLEQAFFALATVIHRSPERIVLDLGLKQLAVDRGMPNWIGDPAAQLRLSDEHASIAVQPSSALAIGDRTFVVPRHIDPTINLHPALWLYENGVVTASPVEGRMGIRRAP